MAKCTRFSILLFLSIAFLVACATKTTDIYIEPPEAQRRAYIHEVAEDLADAGAQLVLIGETVRIIFPSDKVFGYCSVNLSPNYLEILDQTARMMRRLEAVSVKVSGYTNCKPSHVLNRALSKQQAELFAEYLVEQRIDARVVPAYGYGTQNPIVMNEYAKENRRIEVSFQYEPLLDQYREFSGVSLQKCP